MSSFLAEMWRFLIWWVLLPTGVFLTLLVVAAFCFEWLDKRSGGDD